MKRQKRYAYEALSNHEDVPMYSRGPQHRIEETLEAQVQTGDTLQALALRFNCTVAEIKRLNKIDKDNEIFARKVIKVPITPYSVLLETLPQIHKSGQSSPKREDDNHNNSHIHVDPLRTNDFRERLLVASVNSANLKQIPNSSTATIDNILSSPDSLGDEITFQSPLLSGEIDESLPHPRPIPIPSNKGAFDCSGSDCDMSWICLLFCILGLCFAIPLIYVIYIAEHLDKLHHNSTI